MGCVCAHVHASAAAIGGPSSVVHWCPPHFSLAHRSKQQHRHTEVHSPCAPSQLNCHEEPVLVRSTRNSALPRQPASVQDDPKSTSSNDSPRVDIIVLSAGRMRWGGWRRVCRGLGAGIRCVGCMPGREQDPASQGTGRATFCKAEVRPGEHKSRARRTRLVHVAPADHAERGDSLVCVPAAHARRSVLVDGAGHC